MAKESIFKRVYDFYSSDLTSAEFENLFLKETPSRYKYYVDRMEKPRQHDNKFVELLSFAKNLVKAFLKKLSPLVRIIYSVMFLAFFLSMFQDNWDLALFSFVVLNLLFVFEVADKLTAKDELEVARDVQTSLIPSDPPADDSLDISFYYETAREVGGDFIDFIPKNDESYYISIGDVSGKGMSAALYMMQVRLLIRYLSENYDSPREILTFLNRNIFRHIKKGLYLSAVIADVREKNLKVCRAGHTPLIYYNAEEQSCSLIKQNGMAVGLCTGELFEQSLEEFDLSLKKNDIVLFYSDGLTEAMNFDKKEFGYEKIYELIRSNSHKNSEEIKMAILSEVSKFRGYAEVHDDLTMILLKAK